MLEVGWSEILVIALVLIIVVGPKELPGMLRTFGRMATRVRGMANEFRAQFDEALREADLDDVRKGLNEVNKLNPANSLRDAMNPLRKLGEDIKSDLNKPAAKDVVAPAAASDAAGDEPAIAETSTLPVVIEPVLPPAIMTPAEVPAVITPAPLPVVTEAKPKPRRAAKAVAADGEAAVSPAKPARKPRKTAEPVETPAAAVPKPKKPTTRKKSDSTGDA
jgi:sec-independent protein translocase protein TatB